MSIPRRTYYNPCNIDNITHNEERPGVVHSASPTKTKKVTCDLLAMYKYQPVPRKEITVITLSDGSELSIDPNDVDVTETRNISFEL